MPTHTPQPPTSNLPSYFTVLRLVCRAFEVEMPEMDRMLQLVRGQEQDPDRHFPKKLNRVMLAHAESGRSKWSKGLAVVAERALHARTLGIEDKPTFSNTGVVAREAAFLCLRLYEQIVPKLQIRGIKPEVVLWVLIEQVFIPTVFAHLVSTWQRGLGHEFLPIDPWYLPRFERAHQSPLMRVFRSWMRAIGYRTAHDFGKALDDDTRRKVDGWLNGQHVPTVGEVNALVARFADEVSWLDSASDWKSRIALAVAMTGLCVRMDKCFQSEAPRASLKLRGMLATANDDKVPIDSRRELGEPRIFFAVRLLKLRLIREKRWNAEVVNPVKRAVDSRPPTNATMEQAEIFRSDLNWKSNSGNWLLAFIEHQNSAQNRKRKQQRKHPISWQETLMDMAVNELNLILKEKGAGERNAHRP